VQRLGRILEAPRVSSVYETTPLYLEDQPRFLNIAVGALCALPPEELLREATSIEARMGRDRRRSVEKGPRIIDIDILLHGELVVRRPELQIPHPGMYERQFVLIPLLELDPQASDPVSGKPFSEILAGLKDQGVYIFSRWSYTQGGQ
jgi:2-amino-4-hydroxy-6-hydroxymethyldihydropteridine diphosphokinase